MKNLNTITSLTLTLDDGTGPDGARFVYDDTAGVDVRVLGDQADDLAAAIARLPAMVETLRRLAESRLIGPDVRRAARAALALEGR